ncbi:MAG TPA: hypothetical protein VFM08_03895 [Nocardioides sp.]|nr:hypothetical protein [Nocardioides sp.]
MWAVVWVVGMLVVLVGALLAVDWMASKRTKGRLLARAKDQYATDKNVGYTTIENQSHGTQFNTWSP